MALEQEVKLRFDTIEAARHAIQRAGGRLVVARRLIDDQLYDRPGAPLQAARSTLRIRRDNGRGILTFKGPVLQGPVKIREEIETPVADVIALEAIVAALGFTAWFRAQKYREEFAVGAAHVALDKTPIGVFVEIEAAPDAIEAVTRAFGRSTSDYLLGSYQSLFVEWAAARGLDTSQMVF